VAIPAGLWNNIAFRRPMAPNIGNANSACTANATIVLSTSPTPHTSPSTTFANNHGQNQTTVLNGMVNLPPRFNGTWPAPWETIAFTTPFVFIRASGQSLVVDLLQTGNTATSSWIVEAYNRDTGNRENNGQFQSNCKFSTGQPNGGLGHNNPYLGGSWLVSYSGGMPSGLMGVGAIGTRGAGQMWGSLLLPIDLSVFGAPGCNWSVSAELTVPLSSSSSSYPWPSIRSPTTPR
jgi:hypothetical protein